MIETKDFGKTKNGDSIKEYILKNEEMSVSIINYAGAIKNIFIKDKNGVVQDVVLGYDTIEGYESGNSSFGAFVGRFANRIKGAEFSLNGKHYTLEKNDGNNHLHGAFTRCVMDASIEDDTLVLTYISPSDEEGYPGELSVTLKYTLTPDNALVIDYTATTDEDTVVNLTNHSYFNLNGQDGDGIMDHEITLIADRYTPATSEIIPTGEIHPVDDTPFDLRKPTRLGDAISSAHPQTKMCNGIDHNLIFPDGEGLRLYATLYSKYTGIKMESLTTEPAVQVYTGNVTETDSAPYGKNKKKYPNHFAICLETQHYPCSPNFPHFPTTVLKKGDTYRHTTVYKFETVK